MRDKVHGKSVFVLEVEVEIKRLAYVEYCNEVRKIMTGQKTN